DVWQRLSITRDYDRSSSAWAQQVKGSLRVIPDEDAAVLMPLLRRQQNGGLTFPVDPQVYEKFLTHVVRRGDKDVAVTIPEVADDEPATPEVEKEVRESSQIQALLADIGARMGLKIWLPKPDRGAVLTKWTGDHSALLDRLPLN